MSNGQNPQPADVSRADILKSVEQIRTTLALPTLFGPTTRGTTHPTDTVSTETKQMVTDLRQFGIQVIDENKLNLHNMASSIRRSYWTLYIMYCSMFVIGIATAVVAIIKGFLATNATDTYSSLIFAGLSAASFFALFISKPLQSLERNAIFASWLIAATNTYWTEYAYFDDPGSAYDDLKKATGDLTTQLKALADEYANLTGNSPAPGDGGGNSPGPNPAGGQNG